MKGKPQQSRAKEGNGFYGSYMQKGSYKRRSRPPDGGHGRHGLEYGGCEMGLHKLSTAVISQIWSGAGQDIREAFNSTTGNGKHWSYCRVLERQQGQEETAMVRRKVL